MNAEKIMSRTAAIAEPTLSETVPGARVAFARLCAVGFLAYCSYAICRTPLLPLLARELGANAPMVGFIVGASTLTGVVLKLPAGALSDLLGRRPLLVTGGVIFAVMPFMYLGVASLGVLVALRFVHGSATAIFGPVASASLSDLAPAQRRATWLSTYSTIQGAGQALGPVIAGYLIMTGRYDLAFAVAGLVAISAAIIMAGSPTTRSEATGVARAADLARGVREVANQPLILMTSVAQAAQFVLNGTLNAFLPLFARDVVGLSVAQVGWLFGLQTVTTLATRPLMGMISDRIGRRGVIATGLTLCSGAVLLVSFANGPAMLVSAVILYAAGVAVTTAATSAFITDLSQRARYGAAHGVFGTIYDVGDALGPIGAGVLVASLGYARMFQVMAAVALIVTAAFYVVSWRAMKGNVVCE
jgi:DHA1 family multidrug resistance protein-like MFS transporter